MDNRQETAMKYLQCALFLSSNFMNSVRFADIPVRRSIASSRDMVEKGVMGSGLEI